MTGLWFVTVLPAVALGNTLINLLTWPVGRRRGPSSVPVSVLIPARNEALTIEAAVRSALREPVDEVVVCDDRSTDATAEILATISDPRLRVVTGEPLATGWVGKVAACERLAREARNAQLLFLDADTELSVGGLGRLFDLKQRYRADLVTAFPAQRMGTVAEKLLMPLLHLTYMSWLPLALIHRTKSTLFLAANGQVVFVDKASLAAAGGFEAIRAEVVDDMALCRQMKTVGRRVVFADGAEVAACRMYRSGAEVWQGFAKNLYEGLGSVPMLVTALMLYAAAFLLPVVLLALVSTLSYGAPVWVAVGCLVLQRSLIAARFRHAAWPILLQPFAVLALMALAVDSWRLSRSGRISWKGRDYAPREARGA